MNIEGTNGNVARVDDNGKLQVLAVTQNSAQTFNEAGNVFRIIGSVTPTGLGDIFFYLENIGTNNLAVSGFTFSGDVKLTVEVISVSGTPIYSGEVAAPVANLNLGSSTSLPAIANNDVDITGLTQIGLLSKVNCTVADTDYTDDIVSAIIIPQGKALAFRRVEAAGTVDFNMGIGIIT